MLRLTSFQHLVDLGRIASLRGIEWQNGWVRVGATTTESVDAAEVGRHALSSLTSSSSDLHGSAEHRSDVGAVMVSRAWRAARREAAGE